MIIFKNAHTKIKNLQKASIIIENHQKHTKSQKITEHHQKSLKIKQKSTTITKNH